MLAFLLGNKYKSMIMFWINFKFLYIQMNVDVRLYTNAR